MTPESIKNDSTVSEEVVRSVRPLRQHIIAPDGATIRDVVQVMPVRRPIEDIVDVRLPKRTSTYYAVTEAEIDSYAQFGWLSSLLLAFFGTSSGFALGCLAALLQGNIPADSQVTLKWLAGVTGVVSIVFLIFSITLKILQSRNKKKWKSEG